MDEKELSRLKKKIEDAEQEVSRLEGRKSHLLEELKEKWGCDTVEQAEKELEKMETEYQEKENKLEGLLQKLQNDYGL